MSEQNDTNDHNEDMRGPKRKRLAQACDVCRRKKIKCDGVKPMCGNCKRTGRECTYNPNVKKRGPRQGYMEMLEKRLDKMEKMLTRGHELSQQQQQQQQQQQHSSSADSTLSEDASNTRSPQPPNNNPIISQQHHCSSSSTATANNSVINEPTSATTVASFSPANNVNTTFPTTSQQQQQQQSTSVLPSTDIVLHLIHLFFEYIYNYTPIFDKETLIRDVQEQRCPEFLILAIMAVSARYSDRSDIAEDPPWHSGEKYACKARDMVLQAIDAPSMANVQALHLLALHEYGCARGPRSWMLSGMAIRMALEIGLNREPGLAYKDRPLSTAQWMQHEVQRQLFWSIFAVDRFMSASTGRPPILQEEDCEILLPCDEDGWCTRKFYTESINKEHYVLFNVCPMQGSNLLGISTTISSEPLVDGNGNRLQLSCMANVYRGAALLGRLTVFINRKCRQRKLFTPDGPGSDFAQLDQAIDEWYSNFPAELQYTPANMACHRQRSMPCFCRFLLLHTLHNTMIVLLHRPALAQMDSSNADNVQPHLRECYAASAAKCMRAVATVTDLIGYIKENKVLISPFLTYLTYTVATIVVNSIFFGKGDDVYKSKKALTEHFSLLQNLRSYWAMADKLYFMIRDLYAMHTNFTRQQQQSTIPAKRTSQQSPGSWPQSTNIVSMPCQSTVRQQEWTTFTPETSVQQQQQQPPSSQQPVMPMETMSYNTTTPGEHTNNGTTTTDGSLRGMSLADLALSTADGASSTNWILGDNSKNLAAAMQFLGGMPANNSNPYYASNIPFTSAPQQWPSYDFSDLPTDPN